jgi:hypothetical protein
MSHITSTEVILPSSLSAEARHQLTDSLYAVHARLFESEEDAGNPYRPARAMECHWLARQT